MKARSPKKLFLALIIGVVIFSITLAATAWRLDKAPDIFTDEIVYTRASLRTVNEGALVWDSGKPLLVHPPLYFLTQGLFLRITGANNQPSTAPGDIFAAVFASRWLNALIAALTAVLLYLIGYQISGPGLGILIAILFILDPFGLRINRRAMLETMAAFLTMAGMGVWLTAPKDRPISWARGLLAGLILGLALLTKELAITALAAILLFGVWETWLERRAQVSGQLPWASRLSVFHPIVAALLVVVTAFLTYLIYPSWELISGNWQIYFSEKFLELERMLGLVQITGWNRPGISLRDLLVQRLTDYGTSYLLFALGGFATLLILLLGHRQRSGRLLASWGLVLYPFFAFLAVGGSGNDQFFYFLLLPALLLVSYVAINLRTMLESADMSFPRFKFNRVVVIAQFVVPLLLITIIPYDVVHWYSSYGIGLDNGYSQLRTFVDEQVPPSEAINASGDPIKFRYFLAGRQIESTGTPAEAQSEKVHYFVLAPKDLVSHYGRMQPLMAQWIIEKGTPLYYVRGDSYGWIYLYRVDYPDEPVQQKISLVGVDMTGAVFHPAGPGAAVGPLAWLLTGWTLLILGIVAILILLSWRFPRPDRVSIYPMEVSDARADDNKA